MIKRNTLLAKTSPQLNVIFKSGYKKTWKFRVKAKREENGKENQALRSIHSSIEIHMQKN